MNEVRETPEQKTETRVAILLAVAAVIAAVIGARAALVGDSGSDTWHQAVRADVRHGAGLVEDLRFVYGEEAPLALQVAEATTRSRELARVARATRGEVRRLLDAEASAEEQVAETVRGASEIAKNRRYARDDGSYDVLARLADQRAKNPDLIEFDAGAIEKRGSDKTRKSSLLVAATIPVAIAFLLGALAEGFERRRRVFVPMGYAFAATGLVLALVIEVSL